MAQTPKLWAIVHGKCPRCRRGDLFNGPIYGFGTKMNSDCSHCKLHFEIEPGYFYAAMYVSYALSVAEIVAVTFLTYIITRNTTSPWLYLGVILGISFLLAPFNFRYSRVLLLYWLSPKIKYHPELDTDDKQANA